MPTAESVKAQLQADIAAANEATGKTDATMHDAVASLIEGFGETLPEASGLSEFPEEAYSVNGADLTAVGEAIAEKSGVEKPIFPDGWKAAVEGIETGEELFFSANGAGYTRNMVIPIDRTINSTQYMYLGATELESVSLPNANPTNATIPSPLGTGTFQDCTKLRKAYMPKVQYMGHYVFRGCTALEEAQVGSIGYPVSAGTPSTLTFYGCTNPDLVLTIYVADDAALPFANSPFGATNATIIYRSATTGEVIEV